MGRVSSGSAAQAAGVRLDDILISVNGIQLKSSEGLIDAIGSMAPGTAVTLEVWRDQKIITCQATLAHRPKK